MNCISHRTLAGKSPLNKIGLLFITGMVFTKVLVGCACSSLVRYREIHMSKIKTGAPDFARW